MDYIYKYPPTTHNAYVRCEHFRVTSFLTLKEKTTTTHVCIVALQTKLNRLISEYREQKAITINIIGELNFFSLRRYLTMFSCVSFDTHSLDFERQLFRTLSGIQNTTLFFPTKYSQKFAMRFWHFFEHSTLKLILQVRAKPYALHDDLSNYYIV